MIHPLRLVSRNPGVLRTRMLFAAVEIVYFVASDGRIYFSNNDGQTCVVKAGTKFELLATNNLGERITASPAISGNALIYRTDSNLYCIDAAAGR